MLPSLLEDRLVQKGTVLQFTTELFRDYLSSETVEALMEVLRKARLETRLLEVFPQQKRSWPEFEAHFEVRGWMRGGPRSLPLPAVRPPSRRERQGPHLKKNHTKQAAGLEALVEYNKRKLYDAHCADLRGLVRGELTSEAPPGARGLAAAARARRDEWGLADGDVAKAVFLGICDSVLVGALGRNQQQVQFSVLKALKHYASAIAEFCTAPRLEAALLQTIQVRGGWLGLV